MPVTAADFWSIFQDWAEDEDGEGGQMKWRPIVVVVVVVMMTLLL